MDKNSFSLAPDIGIYASFKRISYTIHSALAEFVDNSIDSFEEHRLDLETKKVKVKITYFHNKENPQRNHLIIYDDAFGMNYEELKEALRLQGKTKHKENNRRIGEYGLGLKYAATWFGNYWKIETTQKGNKKKYTARMDISKFIEEKDPYIPDFEREQIEKKEHYTIIKIEQLERNISEKEIEKLKDEFKNLYGKKIYNQELEIVIVKKDITNLDSITEKTVTVSAGNFETNKDIAFDRKQNQYYKWKISDALEINNKIYRFEGWIALAKKILDKPGLFLFKKERLIEVCYPKDVFGNFNPRKRIFGKLDLSPNWPVAQTKDKISWEGELKEEFWKKILHFLTKSQIQFGNKNIFKLADEIRDEENQTKKTKKIKQVFKEAFKNDKIFTPKINEWKLQDSSSHNDSSQNEKKLDDLSSQPSLKSDFAVEETLSFLNPVTNQEEKLIVLLDKKANSQLLELKKTSSNGLPVTNLRLYLGNVFFQKFSKKVINSETQILLVRLFCAFVYALSITDQEQLTTILQHLNKYLSP